MLNNKVIARDYVEKNFIHKETIIDKIEEYKHKDFISLQLTYKHDKEAEKVIKALQELLQEAETRNGDQT